MKALILVDIQNDFLPGGALEVKNGDAILSVVNESTPRFDIVAATQDWHPPDHSSFASNREGKKPFDVIEENGAKHTLWPDHCVQGSSGADFPSALDLKPVTAIFRKGMDPAIDSYSGFFDNRHQRSTGLADWLRGLGVDSVFIVGLAAEICVAYTADDAVKSGFTTTVVLDGTRALDKADFRNKRTELEDAGVRFAESDAVAPG